MSTEGKKSFWKRGNDSKLPGRYGPTYCLRAIRVHTIRAHPVAHYSPDLRPRSKTFEEYEKDTDDAWDEEPGNKSTRSVGGRVSCKEHT